MSEDKKNKESIGEDFNEDTIKVKNKKSMHQYYVERGVLIFLAFLSVLLYILLSIFAPGPYGPYKLNGWSFWWIIFLFILCLQPSYRAIKYHNIGSIPIDVFLIGTYLVVGLYTGNWHPYWVIFFLSPLYHTVCHYRKNDEY